MDLLQQQDVAVAGRPEALPGSLRHDAALQQHVHRLAVLGLAGPVHDALDRPELPPHFLNDAARGLAQHLGRGDRHLGLEEVVEGVGKEHHLARSRVVSATALVGSAAAAVEP